MKSKQNRWPYFACAFLLLVSLLFWLRQRQNISSSENSSSPETTSAVNTTLQPNSSKRSSSARDSSETVAAIPIILQPEFTTTKTKMKDCFSPSTMKVRHHLPPTTTTEVY